MNAKRVVALVLVLVVFVAVAAYAQAPAPPDKRTRVQKQAAGVERWGGAPRPGDRPNVAGWVNLERILMPPSRAELERLAIMLGLTEQQKAEIQGLLQKFHQAVEPARQLRAAGVKEVLAALSTPAPSKGALEAGAAKVQQADKAVLDAEFDFWIAFKRILNAQQQQSLTNFLQQRGKVGPGPGPGAPAPGMPPGPVTPP